MQMTDCVTSDSRDQNTKHPGIVGQFVAKGTVNETTPAPPTDQQFTHLPALFGERKKEIVM